MNKKFKKLIATVSAIVMCAVPMTAVNSNAYWFMKSTEQYQQEVDSINDYKSHESRPDLCERFTKLIRWYDESYEHWLYSQPEKRVENIWMVKEHLYTFMPFYYIDTLYYDSFHAYIKLSDTDDFTAETIKEEINKVTDMSDGIKDFLVEEHNSSGNPAKGISILINFADEDHEENYKRCTAITEYLKQYNLLDCTARLDWHSIEHQIMYLNSIDFDRLSDNEVAKINEDFKAHGFNAYLGKREDLQGGDLKDNYFVKYENPEEWTLEDALDVAVYCNETYGKYPGRYFECSSEPYGDTIDLLNLTGDANEDGEVSIADAILIMQSIMNPDEYTLTEQGAINADIDGDGVTLTDALAIQKSLATE